MQRHYFIAVRLPEEVKYYLSEVARKVSSLYSFKRWVHREDYHITLAFLGPSEEQQWKACMEDIKKKLHSCRHFNCMYHMSEFLGYQKDQEFFGVVCQKMKC